MAKLNGYSVFITFTVIVLAVCNLLHSCTKDFTVTPDTTNPQTLLTIVNTSTGDKLYDLIVLSDDIPSYYGDILATDSLTVPVDSGYVMLYFSLVGSSSHRRYTISHNDTTVEIHR